MVAQEHQECERRGDLSAGAQGGVHPRRLGRHRRPPGERQQDGGVEQSAFYTLGSVSFGLQIGGEAAEVVLLVMSQKGVDSLLTSKFKLGGDTSIALGPVGTGRSGRHRDFISFAKSKGLYAGLNLDGSYVDVRATLNKAYYGKEATPVDIIVKRSVSNKGAAPLIEELRRRNRHRFPLVRYGRKGSPFFTGGPFI